MPKPQRTYQKASGVYYIRLLIPKFLQSIVNRSKIAFSLGTKDRRQANLYALEINLAFERWTIEMAKKLGTDIRELMVKLPNGMELDFDLTKNEERQAYDSLMTDVEKIGIKRPPGREQQPTASQFRLTDVFETFKKSKDRIYSDATKAGYYPRIQGFIDFCQIKGIIYIDEVRKNLAVEFREKIEQEKDSPLTVDNYTKSIKQFFDYATQVHKYHFENPFANLHLVKKSQVAKVTDSYEPFNADEIKRLFAIETYRKRFIKPDYFYSPIIALTMGLRLEEVAQLRVSDIYSVNGAWVIDVNDIGDDKELKTAAAKRVLPLSRHVLATNFLVYHAYVKERYGEHSLLYPYLIKTKNGYGKNLGYNFTQYKGELIQINPDLKTFHSLRKTLGNLMKQNNLELSLRKRVLGHSMQNDVTETVYSGDYALEYIKHCIDQLDYGVDFSQFAFKLDEDGFEKLLHAKQSKLNRKAVLAERQARLEKDKKKKAA